MKPYPRIAAVDYGKKRVGLAVTDPLHLFARPVGTFSPDQAIETLVRISREEGLEHIVVGWPLLLDGSEGEATDIVQHFIHRLAKTFPSITISKQDERFTSEQAKRMLYEAGLPRKARREKKRIDAAAATVILQGYLDAL